MTKAYLIIGHREIELIETFEVMCKIRIKENDEIMAVPMEKIFIEYEENTEV